MKSSILPAVLALVLLPPVALGSAHHAAPRRAPARPAPRAAHRAAPHRVAPHRAVAHAPPAHAAARPAPNHTPALVAPHPAPVRSAPRPVAHSAPVRPVARPEPGRPVARLEPGRPEPGRPVARPEPARPRPEVARRPGFVPHTGPAVADRRPGLEPGRRPGIGSERGPGERGPGERPVVGLGNRPERIDRFDRVAHGFYANRRGNLYLPGYAHYQDWHRGWQHGYWENWDHFPWLSYGPGAVGWALSPGDIVPYADPYYLASTAPPAAVFDYSQPIPVPAPALLDATTGLAANPDDTADAADAAAAAFDAARQDFQAKRYDAALQGVDRAIQLLPGDATLHQFRALVLFALHQYQPAAATLYPVLAVGPGWDWQTLSALYPDQQTYTDQLRALEQYVRDHPQDAASRFVLAYQYLVLDARAAAVQTLKAVVALQPQDQVSARMLQQLTRTPDGGRPVPGI